MGDEGSATGGSAVLLQYLALAVAWGVSFLFIKIGLEGLSPGQVVLARLGLGAVALWVACLALGHRVPTDRVVWGHLLAVVLLLCVVPFLLFAWAEQFISSGLASVDNATTPLMTMMVALGAVLRVARSQAVAAVTAHGRLDVVAHLTEPVDVPPDRTVTGLQARGQEGTRPVASGLEQRQQRQQSRGRHPRRLVPV